MWNLVNSFALGSLAGGVAASIVSSLLLHDADAALWQLCAGYVIFSCISGVIYGAGLKILGYTRRGLPDGDPRRAMMAGAICTVAQYAAARIAGTHEFDRVMLFAAPLMAATLDVMRARRGMPPSPAASVEIEAGTPSIEEARPPE